MGAKETNVLSISFLSILCKCVWVESQGSLQHHSWGPRTWAAQLCESTFSQNSRVLEETYFLPVLLRCQHYGHGRRKGTTAGTSPGTQWQSYRALRDDRASLQAGVQTPTKAWRLSASPLSSTWEPHSPDSSALWRGQLTSVYTPEGLGGRKLADTGLVLTKLTTEGSLRALAPSTLTPGNLPAEAWVLFRKIYWDRRPLTADASASGPARCPGGGLCLTSRWRPCCQQKAQLAPPPTAP